MKRTHCQVSENVHFVTRPVAEIAQFIASNQLSWTTKKPDYKLPRYELYLEVDLSELPAVYSFFANGTEDFRLVTVVTAAHVVQIDLTQSLGVWERTEELFNLLRKRSNKKTQRNECPVY